MSTESAWPVPFFLDPATLSIDTVVAFAVSVLVTTTINAESQAFMANLGGTAGRRPEIDSILTPFCTWGAGIPYSVIKVLDDAGRSISEHKIKMSDSFKNRVDFHTYFLAY